MPPVTARQKPILLRAVKIYKNDDDEYNKRVTAAYSNNGDQVIMTFAVYFSRLNGNHREK